MKLIFICFTLFSFLGILRTSAQELRKVSLINAEKEAHEIAKYEFVNKYDGYEVLCLFKNNTYTYRIAMTGQTEFSNGIWEKEDSEIVLNSAIKKEDVPVELKFFNSFDSSKRVYKTKVQIPINLNGQLLSDSKVFINDDSTYAFPFFDTLVGSYDKIKKIKVEFGDGFKTDWISIPAGDFKQLLIVAQIDFLFSSYVAFRNKRFKNLERGLIAKLEGQN